MNEPYLPRDINKVLRLMLLPYGRIAYQRAVKPHEAVNPP